MSPSPQYCLPRVLPYVSTVFVEANGGSPVEFVLVVLELVLVVVLVVDVVLLPLPDAEVVVVLELVVV